MNNYTFPTIRNGKATFLRFTPLFRQNLSKFYSHKRTSERKEFIKRGKHKFASGFTHKFQQVRFVFSPTILINILYHYEKSPHFLVDRRIETNKKQAEKENMPAAKLFLPYSKKESAARQKKICCTAEINLLHCKSHRAMQWKFLRDFGNKTRKTELLSGSEHPRMKKNKKNRHPKRICLVEKPFSAL